MVSAPRPQQGPALGAPGLQGAGDSPGQRELLRPHPSPSRPPRASSLSSGQGLPLRGVPRSQVDSAIPGFSGVCAGSQVPPARGV